jgi:TetR/AcrR family transcriptional repressor of nem operon
MSLVASAEPIHETKRRLLEAGLELMLQRGYSGLAVQDVLDQTDVPKGSFYHHFESKQDMALQAIDLYTAMGHELLDRCLATGHQPALEQLGAFFRQLVALYRQQGYLGCLLGALGQELSGTSEVFRRKIEQCLASLSSRIAECLEQAKLAGDLPPKADSARLADILLNAWEGAALRSRLLRDPEPLDAALDFCLSALRSG